MAAFGKGSVTRGPGVPYRAPIRAATKGSRVTKADLANARISNRKGAGGGRGGALRGGATGIGGGGNG